MNKTIEALKLAEEALVEYRDNQYIKAPRKAIAAIRSALGVDEESLAAIREALAEPVKQEPVAWATKISKAFFNSPANGVFQVSHLMRDEYNVPLYAAPVDAKAILAEALEEAAKWFAQHAGHSWSSERITVELEERAAAIRGLK